MKLDEKQRQAVIEYMEQVNKLKGKPSKNKGLVNGRQELVLLYKEHTKSKAGNPMLKVRWYNPVTGGSDFVYIMPNKKAFEKTVTLELGSKCDCIVGGVGGFLQVTPLKITELDVKTTFDDYMSVSNIISYDVEVFSHDWSVVFEDILSGAQFKITNSLNKLNRFFQKHEDNLYISYNGNGYDKHIIKAILDHKNPYLISQEIINGEKDSGKVWKMYNGRIISLAEVDLYQDNKGFGLKEHNAFNGLEIKETDIDFEIDRPLTEEELEQNLYYNSKDVSGTTVRFIQMIGALKTKAMLCEMYDLDYTWLFKTNANLIAEILKAEFHEDRGDLFDKYEKPDWIRFDNPETQAQLNEWILERDNIPKKKKTKDGETIWTTDLGFKLKLRDLVIELGSGGVHGAIKNYIKTGEIFQSDVGSLYPTTAVLHGYNSRNIPKNHVHMYSDILKARLEYKAQGEKDKEQAMKLVLNTYYGVLRAKFNKLFDPRQAILINITGQLAMLDLADKIEPYAFISAMNTDSINYEPYNEECKQKIEEAKKDWCERSGYLLDTDIITSIAQRDINNYICRFDTGKIKSKGAVSMGGGVKWSKAIVMKATEEYFMNNTPVEETITNCTDLRDFQIISKTGWTFDETRAYTNESDFEPIQKVNRSFAVKEESDHELVKIRKYKLGTYPKKPSGDDPKKLDKYNKDMELLKENILAYGEQEALNDYNEQIVVGLPREPDFYTISNESIEESKVKLDDLDLQYYIDEALHMVATYEGLEEAEDEEEIEEEE